MSRFSFKRTTAQALLLGLLASAAYVSPAKIGNVASAQITPNFSDTEMTADSAPMSSVMPNQLSIDVYPESPMPNDTVTITARTFGIDTNTNTYTWIVNGREVLRGVGQNRFAFTVGITGTVTNVKLYIDPVDGKRIERDFTYTPLDVDILWQANTYTPPFYKGKALYTPESEVTFTSLPNIVVNGARINPSDVVYRWKVGYKLQDEQSGFGKNSFTYKGTIILREDLIQSEVYSARNPTVKGINGYTLNHVNPQILTYEDHPLLGVLFNRNISGEYYLNQQEVKLATFPLFFSAENKNSAVTYKWDLNDGQIDIPQNQNSAVFRRNNNTAGASFVGLTVGNPSHILQRAQAGISVIYEDARTATAIPFGSN